MDKNIHNKTFTYNYLQSMLMLYRQELVGDKYIDFNIADINQNNTNNQNTIKEINTSNNVQSKTIQSLIDLEKKVSQCRLCSLSNMVREHDRFCGITPKKFEFIDNNKLILSDKFPKLAFIVESLNIKSNIKIPNNTLEKLEDNKHNNMIFDIAQKVFLLSKESIFLFPFFKCVDTDLSQNINTHIYTQPLSTQRRICSDYLHIQLEYVEYAIFFGENICKDLFEITLKEANGKLLDYYTPNNKKIICVCVPDTMQMLINSKLKKEALINFVLLKNAICANSC